MTSLKRYIPQPSVSDNNAYALVTGGSSGIGKQYASQLARDYHYNLLLVSNQDTELKQVSNELNQQYGVCIKTLCIDLAQNNAAEQVFDFAQEQQLEIDVLINNAGFLIFDAFVNVPTQKVEAILLLHTLTATKLCHLFANRWRLSTDQHRRFILNMSSMSAWMAMPTIQCYNATKSYIYNFSKALWYELSLFNIHVLAVTPGSTDTGLLPFPDTFGNILRATGITMKPATLVKKALHSLFYSNKKSCMPGLLNHIIVPIINHLPDWLIFAVMKRLPMFNPTINS